MDHLFFAFELAPTIDLPHDSIVTSHNWEVSQTALIADCLIAQSGVSETVVDLPPTKRRKPGRPSTTGDIADFAHARLDNSAWKDILQEWKSLHPNDSRALTLSKLREAHRRHYRGKAQ